jgi:hypothetical protein
VPASCGALSSSRGTSISLTLDRPLEEEFWSGGWKGAANQSSQLAEMK